MPRVALTDSQRQEHRLEQRLDNLCNDVLEKINFTFLVRKKMKNEEIAMALDIGTSTWCNWRNKKLTGSFRNVAKALDMAGYRVTIEPKN